MILVNPDPHQINKNDTKWDTQTVQSNRSHWTQHVATLLTIEQVVLTVSLTTFKEKIKKRCTLMSFFSSTPDTSTWRLIQTILYCRYLFTGEYFDLFIRGICEFFLPDTMNNLLYSVIWNLIDGSIITAACEAKHNEIYQQKPNKFTQQTTLCTAWKLKQNKNEDEENTVFFTGVGGGDKTHQTTSHSGAKINK